VLGYLLKVHFNEQISLGVYNTALQGWFPLEVIVHETCLVFYGPSYTERKKETGCEKEKGELLKERKTGNCMVERAEE
jgi:hypothetical protein